MHLNLSQITDLILEAKTLKKIEYALDVLRFPNRNAVILDVTDSQRSLLIEQLQINECGLAVNGQI
ncbi:hypothetical protein [Vibrio alginolyticus]|uniref:hypothetical protein n=1 Tax=Vibrio alginolyticus TaxID=663 RepID=UPI0006CA6600|nr:hypothetical protein [Vibrio alginolyticus]KPM98438.1 hypothetical protein AOG25_08310 [Vibrio alginolyticus]CAH7229193.1 conserved hypothetical protein [Vibrio chagasii]